MTVGIGSLCESGKYLVLTSDTLVSYVAQGKTIVSGNAYRSKIYELPDSVFALTADDTTTAHLVLSHLRSSILQSRPGTPAEYRANIELAIDAALLAERGNILRSRGLTESEWLGGTLSAPRQAEAEDALRSYELPVEIIIAGFLRGAPIMFAVSGRKISEENEYCVIGSGGDAALHWLNYRHHDSHFPMARGCLHVMEAKLFSEVCWGVGRGSVLIVLFDGGYASLGNNDYADWANRWLNIVGLKSTTPLADPSATLEFMQLLGITPSASRKSGPGQ